MKFENAKKKRYMTKFINKKKLVIFFNRLVATIMHQLTTVTNWVVGRMQEQFSVLLRAGNPKGKAKDINKDRQWSDKQARAGKAGIKVKGKAETKPE